MVNRNVSQQRILIIVKEISSQGIKMYKNIHCHNNAYGFHKFAAELIWEVNA